jgi:hypothetical protein
MYGYQPSTPADRLLPLTGATANATDRLALIADVRDVVDQLLKLLKKISSQIEQDCSFFSIGRSYFLRLNVYTSVHINANN